MKLSKIKTLLKFASKQKHTSLNTVAVNKGITATDLSTSVFIKDTLGLSQGHYIISELGDYCKPIDNIESPIVTWNQPTVSKTLVSTNDLASVLPHSSKDETRIFLNTVCFDNDKLVATNGYHLKLIKLPVKMQGEYLIHRDSVKVILDFCKAYKLSDIEITFNDKFATIDNIYFTIQCRLIQKDYIRYQAIIPKNFTNCIEIDKYPSMSVLKPFIDSKKPICRIVGIDSLVYLIIGEHINIVIGYNDNKKDFALGFTPNFIEIARENQTSFKLKWNNELSPCEINNCIVMPLKL